MKLIIQREALLKPLQMVIGVVESRQTLPILSHVLVSIKDKYLTFVGTEIDVELLSQIELDSPTTATDEITIPGKALQAGVAGDYIKIRNETSGKIIIARVVNTSSVAIDP